jgi:hypothetical protein
MVKKAQNKSEYATPTIVPSPPAYFVARLFKSFPPFSFCTLISSTLRPQPPPSGTVPSVAKTAPKASTDIGRVQAYENFVTYKLITGVDGTEEPSEEECKAVNKAWNALSEEEQNAWEYK